MSDRKLLKKVRDGDKEALSDIIKQYYADIFRFCQSITQLLVCESKILTDQIIRSFSCTGKSH